MITASLALIILLGGSVLIRVRTQNIVLQTRFDEATKQSGLLEQKNSQLESEIMLRKKIERELRHKQAEVEKQKDELQKAMEQTYSLAYYDTLTGLPNRDLFRDRLHQAQTVAKREGSQFALFFLDLDRFKDINDTLGHSSGDLLLKNVAERLKSCVRESDTVARLGGDEFVLLLNSIKSLREVELIAHKILRSLDSRFDIEGHEIFTSTSVGVVLYPNDGQDAMTLLKQADMAMYSAKDKGRNNYQFFSRELNEAALKRRELETSLRQAIQNEEFFLVYQPQVNVLTGEIIGLEALVRWAHPEKGIIYPLEFISLSEETGLIIPLGYWVARAACAQMMDWYSAGLSGFRVAVNVSGRQFHQATFIKMLDSVLVETKLDPEYLELEFTESILMKNAQENLRDLSAIRKRGIKIAIDDFGTGYSSLSYLRNFPIDLIKIDKSFVHDIYVNSNDTAIVDAIVAMTRSLGIDVLAEGVESKVQCDSLMSRNCIKMQGYHFGRPMTVEEITPLLQQGFSADSFNQLPNNSRKYSANLSQLRPS
jgi:diguanylate cyclase (GGDEF)-like protein